MPDIPKFQAPNRRSRGLKFTLPIFTGMLVAAVALCAKADDTGAGNSDASGKYPSARQLLENAVAGLPDKPLEISGEITVRRMRGVVVRKCGFQMNVNWGADPMSARYTILDESGRTLEQLTVERGSKSPPVFKYARGDPLEPDKMPDLLKPVQGSDMSWLDLTLSFLWWDNGKVTGAEDFRGFDCYVVNLPAPAKHSEHYSRVKLWIEKEINVMLKAEGFGPDGKLLRRLWVRSCKKINDTWMVKDLEVQRFPVVHRTKLHIDEVRIRNLP